MRIDPTKIGLSQASADVEALLEGAGYKGPIENILDVVADDAAEERADQRAEHAGYKTDINSIYTSLSSRRANGADDPNSDKAKQRQAYQVAGQTAAITQQLVQLTTQLTQTITRLTTEIAGLESRELDLARQEGILGEQIEAAEETVETAMEGFDEATQAYEAAQAERAQAAEFEEQLDTIAETTGLTDAWVTAHVRDSELQAQQAAARAAHQQYAQSRIAGEAMQQAEELTAEQIIIRDERLDVQTQIKTLTEELDLTEAQLEALNNEVTLDSIRNGEITPQQAIESVTAPSAADGSSLVEGSAADVDGLGANISPTVELTRGFNTSTGLTPAEAKPAAPDIDLAAQQALRVAEMAQRQNTFAHA